MSAMWTIQDSNRDKLLKSLPRELPILPLRNTVAFPFSMVPLMVGIPRSMQLVEEALEGTRLIGLVTMKDASVEEPSADDVYNTGTVAYISKVISTDEGKLQVIVHGLERIKIRNWTATEPYLKAEVDLSPDLVIPSTELEALRHSLLRSRPRSWPCSLASPPRPWSSSAAWMTRACWSISSPPTWT